MAKKSAPATTTKDSNSEIDESSKIESSGSRKKRGWDEIESLFDGKKQEQKEEKKIAQELQKKERLRTQAIQKERNQKKKNLSMSEGSTDASRLPKSRNQFVDDGLGGKFNSEGYTGRTEDGVKVFKAHVLRRPNAGNTELCPFDCECCFI